MDVVTIPCSTTLRSERLPAKPPQQQRSSLFAATKCQLDAEKLLLQVMMILCEPRRVGRLTVTQHPIGVIHATAYCIHDHRVGKSWCTCKICVHSVRLDILKPVKGCCSRSH
eukprot:scpid55031/ scgid29551/ 